MRGSLTWKYEGKGFRKVFLKRGGLAPEKSFIGDSFVRHGNWKKCLGSTEPKWPGSRSHLGPGGVLGQHPAGGSRGAKPPQAENKFGYFGDQFAASQCTGVIVG